MSALQSERFSQKTRWYINVWKDVMVLGGCFFCHNGKEFWFGSNGDAFETWAHLLSYRAWTKS